MKHSVSIDEIVEATPQDANYSNCTHLLVPHQNAKVMRYYDSIIRRRLLEHISARFIQHQYRKYKLWFKIKYKVNARIIEKAYYNLLMRRREFERVSGIFITFHRLPVTV
jgi:hypothetical protein